MNAFRRSFFIFFVLLTVISQLAAASPKVGSVETATFAAGCFWGADEFFRKIPGVIETETGYTGGTIDDAKYWQVRTGKSGHAESVRIIFDPKKTSYTKLLNLFFKMHDPTTLNRQGADKGPQYRSAIFYHDEKQKKLAEAFKTKVEKSKAWKDPVVTEITEAKKFWPAEDEHQKYLIQNPNGYNGHYLRQISFEK